MKKPPRFFCDNCGMEVGNTDRACPNCGRLFVSVRCPNCGFSGEEKRFQNGCPLCGYSDPNAGKIWNAKEKKKKPKKVRQKESLPVWIYIALGASLLIFAALLSRLFSL